MPHPIRFNEPRLAGNEVQYVSEAIATGALAGSGRFADRCREILSKRLGLAQVWLTGSCTAALEISALLLDLRPGDEVVLPSFTHVATATAFVRAGARPVFADIRADTLNLDANAVEAVVTPRTRAIVPVHYGGVGCDMDAILAIARRRGLRVVEDAAHGLGARYRQRPLGTIGDFGCVSFHETKNVQCGQGGALCVNHADDLARAAVLFERGTDRADFLRGEIPYYSWVDLGSSFALNEMASAFLCAQLEAFDAIAHARRRIRTSYARGLRHLEERGLLRQPVVPAECETNDHTAAVLLPDGGTRDGLMRFLGERGIQAVSHYVPLHLAPYGRRLGPHAPLPITEATSVCLLRLPLHNGLQDADVARVVETVEAFFRR